MRALGRWATRGAGSLLAGAVVAVLLAWACTLWGPVTGERMPPTPPEGDWPDLIPGPPGEQPGYWYDRWGWGWEAHIPQGAKGSDGAGFLYWSGQFSPALRASGWPLYAVRSRVEAVERYNGLWFPTKWQLPPGEIWRRGIPTSELPSWLHARQDTRLGLIPVWPGLMVNAAIFALPAGLVIWGSRAGVRGLRGWWRRRRRARLGHPSCECCGYNLTGLPQGHACPECGSTAAVASAHRQ